MKLLTKLTFLFALSALIMSCNNSDKKTETSEAGEVAEITGTTYTVQPEDSKIMWNAAKVTGKHNGTVDVQGGTIAFEDDVLKSGNFTIDMMSINVMDLEGDYKKNLEAHLKGTNEEKQTDFFNAVDYPTAKFEITKATILKNNPEGNYIINGNLTIKDITKQISFKAQVDQNNGMVKVTTPEFSLDRTEWDIRFRSTKFFDDLKDKEIYDEFNIQISLVAK